ncbi:ATPase [Microcoleus vaginatus PCC 9802]|uniref:sensor histidine kinase n=1 Tax=Microcoleus vaginatus TaxID=119532 RepID=UPI00020D2D25|nr:integral membrane sensor signal transduction histidine kinase [Microcoleus vaginatus FGP-2]UNU21074.1 ATPase [Microcoleus vaginatus PCC 9802]
MQEMWKTFFSSGSFIPHGHCYLWQTPLVWLHVASDSIIALAYFSIPITLIYFISKREDLPFDWIFTMFGGFIVACGITHIFEVWTLWHPTYWLSGTMKAITALISFATAILLVDLIPQALALPSPAQLESANRLLESEIVDRQLAEAALQKAKEELEIRVEERTAELKSQTQHLELANRLLASEIVERQLAEAALKKAKEELEIRVEERTAELKSQTQQLEQALSELKQAQSKLIHSEKMSSLGQLVAGLAHEINNPINFIYGNLTHTREYADTLIKLVNIYQEQYPNPLPTLKEKIESIDLDFIISDLPKILISMRNGAERIFGIVKSLRIFSRHDEAERKVADIHEGIDSTLMILQSRLNAKPDLWSIQVLKEYGNLPKIECYPGQLNQVFMNILANAIDALEDDSHSESMAGNEANRCLIKISTKLSDSQVVEIRISNNGPEITESVRNQLFNPFFTTKPVGKGTGLGLSIGYQIITVRHKGELHCISAPGKGAEFIIKIPITLQETFNNPHQT